MKNQGPEVLPFDPEKGMFTLQALETRFNEMASGEIRYHERRQRISPGEIPDRLKLAQELSQIIFESKKIAWGDDVNDQQELDMLQKQAVWIVFQNEQSDNESWRRALEKRKTKKDPTPLTKEEKEWWKKFEEELNL